MKLIIVHQNQDDRGGESLAMKKEEMGIGQKEELPLNRDSPQDDENSPPLEPTPVSAFNPMIISGKRKRKPKELIDEVSPDIIRKRPKASASKSKDLMRDGRGTTPSNVYGNADGSNGPVQLKSPTVIRAEEVQSSLGNEHPSVLKPLVRSHVGSCFWMGLPVPFCKMHLPSRDAIVILENEDGEEFPIKYIAHKTGLSAGWRKFVAGNKLLEGDVLIFQLIAPCRFKVYIIRANDLTEVDGALSLLILDSQTKQNDAAEGTMDGQCKKKRRPRSLPMTIVQTKKEIEDGLVPESDQPEEYSGNDSDEVASEVLEGTKLLGSSFQSNDIKGFDEFRITINGVCIDSEIPEHICRKYYDLCYSKNAYLHDCLLPGLHSKLASGMIVEATNIADAIRCCSLTTPRSDFEVWEKSLRSFELLGLNVGFLRARLRRLLCLSFESEGALEVRRHWEAQMELNQTEDEIQKVEAKLVELKQLSAKFRHEIEELGSKAEKYQRRFQEEVDTPW